MVHFLKCLFMLVFGQVLFSMFSDFMVFFSRLNGLEEGVWVNRFSISFGGFLVFCGVRGR